MASLVCQFVYAVISIMGRRSNTLTLTVRSSEYLGAILKKTKRIVRLKSDKIFPFKWIFMCFCAQILFVCVEVLWPSQPNGVMSSAVSLPNHTFTGQA